MKKKLTKQEANEMVRKFFSNLQNKNPEQIKKIKRLAMHYNIKLGRLRRKFCKRCYSVFNAKNAEIRIENGKERIRCLNCGYVGRWKITKAISS